MIHLIIHRPYRYRRVPLKQALLKSTYEYVYSRGCGLFGALGLGDKFLDSKEFGRVSLTTAGPINHIAASWGHTALSTEQGEVFLIGRPFDFSALLTHYQFRNFNNWLARQLVLTSVLMDSKTTIYRSPRLLEQFLNTKVKSVHCSAALTAILTEKGQVYTLGSNRWGQCGVATYQPRTTMEHATTPLSSQIIYEPSLVRAILEPIQSVDLGLQHCVALSKNGRVYCWGKADRGQLGCGPTDLARYDIPTRVDSLRDVVMISAGFSHVAALNAKGQVFVWGKGMSLEKKESKKVTGDSGPQLYADQWMPRKITLPDNRVATEVCCSNFSVVIRATDGTLWTIGMGEYDRNMMCSPTPVLAHHTEEEDRLLEVARREGRESQFKIPLHITTASSRLVKGHQRVHLLEDSHALTSEPPSSIPAKSNPIRTKVYDIVLHNYESYLLPVDTTVPLDQLPSLEGHDQFRIKHYASGWQHTVMVLEN